MLMTTREAVSKFVNDSEMIFVGGFGNLYPFALAHEVIRQRKRNLILAKHSPELIGDQLIGAGCVSKLIFSWIGNPGIGSSHSFRRATEQEIPNRIELEEYTHASITSMLRAGATGVPFIATKCLLGSDITTLPSSKRMKSISCPFTGEKVIALRALQPDIAIIHAQRADTEGNVQAWGILSDIRDGAFASNKVVVSVEEIVSSDLSRRDPNRTLIPGFKVNAIVKEEWGAHPSACQGYYDRDNDFFLDYDKSTKTNDGLLSYLDKWVYSISNRQEYAKMIGSEKLGKLKPDVFSSEPVDYGLYPNYQEVLN